MKKPRYRNRNATYRATKKRHAISAKGKAMRQRADKKYRQKPEVKKRERERMRLRYWEARSAAHVYRTVD